MYQRIKDLREDSDMPQREVARLLNMSQKGYSKYETGENDVPTAVLIKLSLIYHVSVDYILGLTDERNRYPVSRSFTEQPPELTDCTRRYNRK
jgi:Predicted transcriptional regulators